jgi:exopolysaccharide production protein ExoQ
MSGYPSKWQLAQAHSLSAVSSPPASRFREAGERAEAPVWQQILTWLLFWTMLSLIARQPIYVSGPARTAAASQSGAAMGLQRGTHIYLYLHLILLFAFVLAGHRAVWAVVKKNLAIPAMLILAVISARWSASPQITLQMCIEVGLCTLFACYLSARFTAERLMELLMFMGVVSGLLSILFALELPNYGIFQGYGGGAWQGICDHKNTLGISSVYLLSPVFFTDSYSRWGKISYGALQLFLIYMSQSRGAWGYTVGMLLFIGWIYLIRRITDRELTFMVMVSGIVIILLAFSVVHFWPIVATALGKDSSMTGRTQIYYEVWQTIMRSRWLGYGFGGFWFPGSLESQRIGLAIGWPGIGYAENGVLELALQIGFVGVGIVFLFLGRAFVQGLRLLRSPQYSPPVGWFLTILAIALLTNIDAGWFLTADTLDWVLIVIACVSINAVASLQKRVAQ